MVENPMKVLVTGASGFIGSRLCRHLIETGHEVVAVVRPRLGDARFPLGEIVYGQLPYGIPPAAFDSVEAIIHCAGTTTGQGEAESYAVNVETTRVLAQRATKLPHFRRFIFVSSQSAHERAVSVYGRTKREGEEVLRRSGVPYAIVRPGLVFGPGSEGLFARMRRSIEKLPVIPLLGGGTALVQPIDVADLCAALERCLHLPADENFELNLGEPEPMTLAEFLAAVSSARTGKPKRSISIPLAPIEFGVRIAETLRIPLPITKDNLEGMKTVPRMETRSSLERLGLELTPFATAIKKAALDISDTALVQEPLRVLLIGAGKIGIVHALDLVQRPRVVFAGLVDPSKKAARLYQQMGFRVPHFSDLDRAMAATRPAAAIVATPAFTHLDLVRQCLQLGLHILVEKPLTVNREQAEAYEALRQQYPERVIHVGYMATQFPQLDFARQWLNDGRIGPVKAVWASSLQSHIIAPEPVRWEMRKALAGGGVLTNFGCHLLSILFRLFGMPQRVDGQMWSIHSREVEDAADLSLAYESFRARIVTSWSAKGFARPQMRLIIEGEHGAIYVTNAGAELVDKRGETLLVTQRDFDLGFNPAPDYTGAAFACEHLNFLEAVHAASAKIPHHAPPARLAETPVQITEALQLERFIQEFYASHPSLERPTTRPSEQHLSCGRFCQELDRIVEALR
jgi:NADH dehydrogenase